MVSVHVEVREGTDLFSVAVRAESIGRAVNITKERHPGREVRVVFPIDPHGFFDEGRKKAEAGPAESGQPRALRGPLTRV